MDYAEAERIEYGTRYMKECRHDVERMLHVLSVGGVDSTELEVAKLWFEFSMWWVAAWLPLPQSDRELLHILMRGLRKRSISERDWDMKCLDQYYVVFGMSSAVPIRWDVTPAEFDIASGRLLKQEFRHLERDETCAIIAKWHFIGRLEEYPGFADDLAKIRIVAAAYWHPAGRRAPDGYPR